MSVLDNRVPLPALISCPCTAQGCSSPLSLLACLYWWLYSFLLSLSFAYRAFALGFVSRTQGWVLIKDSQLLEMKR